MLNAGEVAGLVLDTSVWINLLATEAFEPILSALAVPCYAPEQVIAEVKRHPVSGTAFYEGTHPLRQSQKKVCIVSLDETELDLFLEIVGAPTRDALGDGKAAAIAIAASRGLGLVIDDKKARRIVKERFSGMRLYWTVDLLEAEPVIATLGRPLIETCFSKAVRFGRMHVSRT